MAHNPLKLVNLLREGMGISVDESTAENLLKLADHRGENGYVQWMSRDGKNFSPASVTRNIIPPGVYEIDCDMQIGIFFSRVPTNSEGLIRFLILRVILWLTRSRSSGKESTCFGTTVSHTREGFYSMVHLEEGRPRRFAFSLTIS